MTPIAPPRRSDAEVEALVEANMSLAHFWARKTFSIEPDQALSLAMNGLLLAAQEWDERFPFGSYASQRIKWQFSRYRLHQGRKKRGSGATHVYLDAPVGEDGSSELGEFVADESDGGALSALLTKDNAAVLLKAVKKLRARDRKIISARFGLSGDGQTLEEIGLEFGVTKERIRQIEVKVLARLKRSLGKRNAIAIEGPKHLGRRAYHKEWSRRNRDKVRAYAAKWQQSETWKTYRAKWNKVFSARWRERHPDYNRNYWRTVRKPKSKAYYAANKARILERTKQWQRNNRHHINAYKKARRLALKATTIQMDSKP